MNKQASIFAFLTFALATASPCTASASAEQAPHEWQKLLEPTSLAEAEAEFGEALCQMLHDASSQNDSELARTAGKSLRKALRASSPAGAQVKMTLAIQAVQNHCPAEQAQFEQMHAELARISPANACPTSLGMLRMPGYCQIRLPNKPSS